VVALSLRGLTIATGATEKICCSCIRYRRRQAMHKFRDVDTYETPKRARCAVRGSLSVQDELTARRYQPSGHLPAAALWRRRLSGSAPGHPHRAGRVRPYRGLIGALKVRDQVEVALDGALSTACAFVLT
jgi:hypothetical protein